MVFIDAGGRSDIAIPSFALIHRCSDGEDIIPAVGIEIFDKVVTCLKSRIAQVARFVQPGSVEDDAVGGARLHIGGITDDLVAERIEFYNREHNIKYITKECDILDV